jgi:hypothetical protein
MLAAPTYMSSLLESFFITIDFDTNNGIFPLSFALFEKETNYK